MFFVYSIRRPTVDSPLLQPGYWQSAKDAIPALPPEALYLPSVIPGFSAAQVGYVASTTIPRLDGAIDANPWKDGLGTGVQPAMVTVTSFKVWHEGTMIEPPAFGGNDGRSYSYADFGSLPPDGYLILTRQWVDKFLQPPGHRPPGTLQAAALQRAATGGFHACPVGGASPSQPAGRSDCKAIVDENGRRGTTSNGPCESSFRQDRSQSLKGTGQIQAERKGSSSFQMNRGCK